MRDGWLIAAVLIVAYMSVRYIRGNNKFELITCAVALFATTIWFLSANELPAITENLLLVAVPSIGTGALYFLRHLYFSKRNNG